MKKYFNVCEGDDDGPKPPPPPPGPTESINGDE